MQHKSILVFDIETIPDTAVVPRLTGLDEPDENARRAALEAYHLEVTEGRNPFPRQPFHRIVAIAFLLAEIERDGTRESYFLHELRAGGTGHSSEAELVAGFFQFLERRQPRLVTFNGRGFDLPVLKYRAMVHGIAAPVLYQSGDKWSSYAHRYSEDWHCDLQDVLSDHGASARIKLGEVCAALGFPGKIGVDGSMVAEMWDQKKIGAIRDYCETDVLNTYLVYLRHMLHRGTLTRESYNRAVADIVSLIETTMVARPHLGEFLTAWGEASGNRFTLG